MLIGLGAWWTAFPAFFLTWAAHVVWWRWGRVRREFLTLVLLFIGTPAIAALVASPFYNAYAFFLHILLSANYIAIYPALQASSPTLVILNLLHESVGGLTREELDAKMAIMPLLSERWRDLEKGGLVTNDRTLSGSGRLLAFFFIRYRRALGLMEGAG